MRLDPYYESLLDYYEDEHHMCNELGLSLTDIYVDELFQ